MRSILLVLLLFCLPAASAQPLFVFGTTLTISNKCKIKAINYRGMVSFTDLSLPLSSNCKFIRHDDTNVIHVERISNFYMFLVESTTPTKNGCLSEHTAFIIKPSGSIISAAFSKKSLRCHSNREQKLFLHFAYKMKLIK